MSVYHGPPRRAGPISLVEPESGQLRIALAASDLANGQKDWFRRSQSDDGCLLFAVQQRGRLAGQVFLHDIDWEGKEALVGYHLFRPQDRGHGHGTAALNALCDYAFAELGLQRVIAVTSVDNLASRRIASKSGFHEIGPAREGPDLVVYERVTARAAAGA